MKKIFIATLLFVLLFAGQAIAKDWPSQTDVPVDKAWTVKFNQEIDAASINDYSAYVTDNLGHNLNCDITLGTDSKSIVVNHPWGCYHSYANYSLHVSTTIKSASGNTLSAPADMKFSTGPREGTKTYMGTVWLEEDSDEINVLKIFTVDLEDGTTDKFKIGYFTTVDGDFESDLLNKSFEGQAIYFAVDNLNHDCIQAIFTEKR